MKKLIAITLLSLGAFPTFSQSTQISGSPIYYTTTRVGIGESVPANTLHVKGQIGIDNTNYPGLRLSAPAYSDTWSFGLATGSANPGGLYFQKGIGSFAMVIDPSLRIGIGENSPSQKLDVKGRIRNTSGVVFKGLESGESGWIIEQGTNNLGIKRWNGSSAGSYVNINENRTQFYNNVGIGVDDPQDKLHINGNLGVGFNFQITDRLHDRVFLKHGWISGVGDYLALKHGGNNTESNTYGIRMTDVGAAFEVGRNDFNTIFMKVERDGNVGIGIDGPQAKLDLGIESANGLANFVRMQDGNHEIGRIAKLSSSDGRGLFVAGYSHGSTLADPSLVLAGYANDVSPDSEYDAAVTIRGYDVYDNGTLSNMPTFRVLNGHTETQLIIDADGKVGMGTNSPDYTLELDGTATKFGINSTGQNPELLLRKGDVVNGRLSGGANSLYLFGGSDATADVTVQWDGKVGIGTTSPDANHQLTVNGAILSEKVKVQQSVNVPDYVFEESYQLRSIADLENYIKAYGHLPEVKSAEEIKAAGGFDLGNMDMALLKKVEELTLYTIDQEKTLKSQQEQLNRQDKQIEMLMKRLEKLENDK